MTSFIVFTGFVYEANAGGAVVRGGEVHGHLLVAGNGCLRRAGLLPLEQRR